MNKPEILHSQRGLRVAVAVRPVRALSRSRDAPAESAEHRVQDADQAEVCQRLVCLALPAGSEESAEDEQDLNLHALCT